MAIPAKIVFWGAYISNIVLEALVKNFHVIAVVTNPDKPVGRKQLIVPAPIKVFAQKQGISVLQPEKLDSDFKFQISGLAPDLFVVAAYGKIIPKEILEIPKHGALNLHPSLLPRWRGASPIQYAILNGDEETGVTVMLMDEKMDHGPILARRELEIRNPKSEIRKYTTPKLSEVLTKMGAELIIETIPKWINGEIKPIPQDESKATYTKILKKEDGKIDWSKPAVSIERQIRAFVPWPGSFTYWKRGEKEVRLEICVSRIADSCGQDADTRGNLSMSDIDKRPGLVTIRKKGLFIQTDNGILEVLKIQPEGKKEMTAKEFINGYGNIDGAILM